MPVKKRILVSSEQEEVQEEKVEDVHEVAPVVKSKKIRSQKQIEALEKGRQKRIENARLKKEGKLIPQKETKQGVKVADFSRAPPPPSAPVEPQQVEENLGENMVLPQAVKEGVKLTEFSRQPQVEVELPSEEIVTVDKVSSGGASAEQMHRKKQQKETPRGVASAEQMHRKKATVRIAKTPKKVVIQEAKNAVLEEARLNSIIDQRVNSELERRMKLTKPEESSNFDSQTMRFVKLPRTHYKQVGKPILSNNSSKFINRLVNEYNARHYPPN